jgi:hypothetical protein
MKVRLKVKKTDSRFRLQKYGFTHFVEMPYKEFDSYSQLLQQCRKLFKDEFWEFGGTIYTNGNWKAQYHYRYSRKESKRIYFRGEKFITMLQINLDETKHKYYF